MLLGDRNELKPRRWKRRLACSDKGILIRGAVAAVIFAGLLLLLRVEAFSLPGAECRRANRPASRLSGLDSRSWSTEACAPCQDAEPEDAASPSTGAPWWVRMTTVLVVCSLLACAVLPAAPPPARAVPTYDANNWTPAPDLEAQFPKFEPDELQRRRSAPSDEIRNEKWFRSGETTFISRCAGCHTQDVSKPEKRLLTTELLEKTGFIEPRKMQFVLRYGARKMPGYAADCFDLGDTARCNVAVPLTEEQLADVQDYVYNRAASSWKELPPRAPPVRR